MVVSHRFFFFWTSLLPNSISRRCMTSSPGAEGREYSVFTPFLPSLKDSERVLHLGPFVCMSAQNFHDFLCNRLSDWDEIFTIGATPQVEWFNYNYDVIGHVVWQPYWKNFGPLYLWNRTNKKIETWHVQLMVNEWFFLCHRYPHYDVIIAYVEHHIQLVWKCLRVISG